MSPTLRAVVSSLVLVWTSGLTGCGDGTTQPPIDYGPAPEFSTFIGGGAEDQPRDVTADPSGNIYVVGGTASFDYPTTQGATQVAHHPGPSQNSAIQPFDVMVTKLDPGGSLVWSTYLGGPNYDRAYGAVADDQGSLYIAGRAGPGFPVTNGALQTTHMGGTEASQYGPEDGFVCKLLPDGSVVFCTYFGGSDPRIVRDVAVDQNHDIYIASGYSGGQWPPQIANAFNNTPRGNQDAVVAKISADGSQLLWATYLGGSSTESNENSVGVDATGNPYVLLTTGSGDAPTTSGTFQRSYGGGGDLYIAKLDPQTGALIWATFVGGSDNESTETHEFAVGTNGDIYVAVASKSNDSPVTTNAFQPAPRGGLNDMYVFHLSSDGTRMIGGTYLGGDRNDRSEGVAIDDSGNIYLTGVTGSADFPVTPDAFQSRSGGNSDAVVVKLSPSLDRLLYSSYLGGSGADFGRGAAVFNPNTFLLVGQTESKGFPTVKKLQSYEGGFDGFVAAFRIP
jgi:hypothetical protein